MFDKEAIEAINEGTGIYQAVNAVAKAFKDNKAAVALPEKYKIHDLEPYLDNRRRARGTMTTESVADFSKYVREHKEAGASVFVEADSMQAVAVLNLGTPTTPGHTDNRAKLVMRKTAAYTALKAHASGQGMTQAKAAEFMEDWQDLIECYADSEAMGTHKAIAAVRDITIEAAKKVESQEQQLSATRSALESVKASSKHTLPTHIYFKCEPFAGLQERTFVLRLGIQTGTDKLGVVLRIVKQEAHDEEMANEFARKVDDALLGWSVPVLVGSYAKA